MVPKVSFPIVVIGRPQNGTTEHPAIITRVWSPPDHDTANGPAIVNATMFPDGGGEPSFENQIHLCDSREEALARTGPMRCAYWAANS